MNHAALVDRCRELQLVLCDVDGVMTDGSLLFGPDGTELKSLNVRDGLGIVLAHHAGLQTGLVSGRSSEQVARRAAELGMAVVYQGVADKAAALAQILDEQRLSASQVAYMGDDLNDLPVMRVVGLSAAPGDAGGPGAGARRDAGGGRTGLPPRAARGHPAQPWGLGRGGLLPRREPGRMMLVPSSPP